MNKFEPRVSIIVPVRNADRTIRTIFEYLLALDYPTDKLEILIADAGSTDKTVEITKEFMQKYKFIKLIEIKNCKSSIHARNAAIKEVKGQYVLFTDGDCTPNKDWIYKIVEPFSQDPKNRFGHPLLIETHAKDGLEFGIQIGRGIFFSIPFSKKGIIHIGNLHMMYLGLWGGVLSFILTSIFMVSGLDTALAISKIFLKLFIADLIIFAFLYFRPVLKLKPLSKFFTFAKIRLEINKSRDR